MKRGIVLLIVMSFILTACSGQSTKKEVYRDSWDGEPVIVKQQTTNGDYETVQTLTDATIVEKLIDHLKKVKWEENIDLDIRPADVQFTWNDFVHFMWINENSRVVELTIEGRSNYGRLSTNSSEAVIDLLLNNKNSD